MDKKKYEIYEMADILHQAADLYQSSTIPIDYGTGEKYTSVEAHMLKYIIDHPGLTGTQLSKDWDKSKAAISKMMKKLEDKNLIRKETAYDSEKKQLYYATEKGIDVHNHHLIYDNKAFGVPYHKLVDIFGEEQVQMAFQIFETYVQHRRERPYRAKND